MQPARACVFILTSILSQCYFQPVFSQEVTTAAPKNKCDLAAWNAYLLEESARRSCYSRCADFAERDKKGLPTGGTICSTSEDCEGLGLDSTDCKPRKLSLQNQRHIFEFGKCCRRNLVELKEGKFGPPSRFEKHGVACSAMCSIYDQLTITRRKIVSKCPCEDVGFCKKSSMFWLCKELWECWGAGDDDTNQITNHFCNACGSTQKDEVEFARKWTAGQGLCYINLCMLQAYLSSRCLSFNML